MNVNATEQLNRSYIRLPENSALDSVSFGIQQVIGEIYSFTGKAKGGKQLSCFRTYDKFAERCNVSRPTVGRALKFGRSKKLIEGNGKDGYTCNIKARKGKFLRLPNWVCKEEFQVRKDKFRKLNNSERKLYALIYTRCTAKKNGNHRYEASIADLAEETGLSERTVQRAIWTLIRAGLIYRPKEDVGVNAYKSSTYTLNYQLVRLKEKTDRELKKEAEKAVAQPIEEPFPEFPAPAQESDEEFVQHSEPQPKPGKKKKARNTYRAKRTVEIPEMGLYTSNGIDYDFSRASKEELLNLRRLYVPQWEYLSVIGQAFLGYVKFELDERTKQEVDQKNK